jgi:hypothetical protein
VAVQHAPTRRSARALPLPDPTRPPGRRHPAAAPHVLPRVACDHRRAPIALPYLVALAVAVCLAVIGLAVLANMGSPAVPERTAVVRVEPGESLLELAERVAPGSDPHAVVVRIRELNGLGGSGVRPGQPLRVPSAG